MASSFVVSILGAQDLRTRRGMTGFSHSEWKKMATPFSGIIAIMSRMRSACAFGFLNLKHAWMKGKNCETPCEH